MKRVLRESKTEYKYGLDIQKTDDYIHIGSHSFKIEDWPKVAAWVLQTVATLKVEETEYEFSPFTQAEIDKFRDPHYTLNRIKSIFDQDDAFYKQIKKR